ncbi:MAG: SDR family oxidoreductase [Proteobacteria bacterium]|nr:SDR family oxidoreductase [Pseudomonadota bacterium]
MKKMRIAILGANGFLGGEIIRYYTAKYDVHGVSRENYKDFFGQEFDVFINAAGNSKRFWANNNIVEDFDASTVSVYRSLLDFNAKVYVYISSSDVYADQKDLYKTREDANIHLKGVCPYGFHKYVSELLVQKYAKKYLILRCAAIIGKGMKKGPVKDILEGQALFIKAESKLQFITASEIAAVIEALVGRGIGNEIFNTGGVGAVSVGDLGKAAGREIAVRPDAEQQFYEMDITKLKKIFSLKRSEDYAEECIINSIERSRK